MEVLAAVAAWAACALCRSLPADTTNQCAILGQLCPAQGVDDALKRRLSPRARIYYPGTSEFNQSTTRWSTRDAPLITITVEPATENDVVETVQYGNERNISFLAVNGGHGAITTVGKMRYGIEIWMRKIAIYFHRKR
jgi:FAD/FMN-containing dehydrogenase